MVIDRIAMAEDTLVALTWHHDGMDLLRIVRLARDIPHRVELWEGGTTP